ncbi:hypothetical protein ONV78_28110 [Hahella sp. CR1]|uniref:hypothetical protein n=1 Tax=Hahella sp. CR1 TaxID=2992807 RepID=UPI002442D373|nr:hypothetical protein [Hahella sp. CR1]MDG9671633.1 hypothetical protein [Hahella sp. CR1]
MKFRELSNWKDPEGNKGLVYFSQLLEELLFDYSLDTYKPSAMNSSLLCEEALQAIKEIGEGNIRKPNIDHILEELSENLSKDVVSNSLLTLDLGGLKGKIKNKENDLQERKVVVELIFNQIILPKYKVSNERILIGEIKKGSDFSGIRSLTRSYVTCLVNLGYSSKFIFSSLINCFYNKEIEIDGSSVDGFFKLFPLHNKKYIVVYKGETVFKRISAACGKLGIKIIDRPSLLPPGISNDKFYLKKDQNYMLIELEAKDQYSAHVAADRRVEFVRTLYTLFHHKSHPEFEASCIIYDVANDEMVDSVFVQDPMCKCMDLMPGVASKKLNNFVSKFYMQKDSFIKFNRCAELHSMAIKSDSKEEKLINLWIALESLIPTKNPADEVSNIEHIINSVIPFLNLRYLSRLLSELQKSMWRFKEEFYEEVVSDVNGDSLVEKLAKVMSLPEYDRKKIMIDNSFEFFYLLRERYKYFCHVLSDPKETSKALENHKKRVGWQLRRIYRSRNLIVHKGLAPAYTDILVENTHDYLDIIMKSIIDMKLNRGAVHSVEQSFKLAEMEYSFFSGFLAGKKTVVNDEFIKMIICCGVRQL